MRLTTKWLGLSLSDKLLIIQVTLVMGAIALGLRLRPAATLKCLTLTRKSGALATAPHERESDRIVWAVSTIGKHVFADGYCLPQALATHTLLRRRGVPSTVCLGVTKDEQEALIAHAWVEVGGVVVVGGPSKEVERFTRLPAIEGASR